MRVPYFRCLEELGIAESWRLWLWFCHGEGVPQISGALPCSGWRSQESPPWSASYYFDIIYSTKYTTTIYNIQ